MILSFSYLGIVFNIISGIGRRLSRECNLQRYGSLYSDTNYKSHIQRTRLAQYYIIIYLTRRLLYVLLIIFLYKAPIIQQVCNIALHASTFVYSILMKPYAFNLLGIIIYFFNFMIFLIQASLPLYMIYPDSASHVGRVQIYIITGVIGISWIVIFSMNFKSIYLKYKKPTLNEQIQAIEQNIIAHGEKDLPILPHRRRYPHQENKRSIVRKSLSRVQSLGLYFNRRSKRKSVLHTINEE